MKTMKSVGGSRKYERGSGLRKPPAHRRRGRRAARAALLVVLVLSAGCAAFFEEPEVRIVGIRVISLGVSGGTAGVDLDVTNPNDRSVRVVGVRYRIQVEDVEAGETAEVGDERWRTLTEGMHSEGVTLEPRDTARIQVEVPFEYRVVGETVRALLQGREVEYRMDGEVRIDGPVGEIRVPVRTTGLLER